jgi:hypothetical protein
MSRKYRQRGYLDQERQRIPKPPPRPRGAAGRVETRFHLITRCNNCAAEIQVDGKIDATDKCKNCGTDLHTCRNCLFLIPSARNECTKPVECGLRTKAINICFLFEPGAGWKREWGRPVKPENSHRQALSRSLQSSISQTNIPAVYRSHSLCAWQMRVPRM